MPTNEKLSEWLEKYNAGYEVETVKAAGIDSEHESIVQKCAVCALMQLEHHAVPQDKNKAREIINRTVVSIVRPTCPISTYLARNTEKLVELFWLHSPQAIVESVKGSTPNDIFTIRKT